MCVCVYSIIVYLSHSLSLSPSLPIAMYIYIYYILYKGADFDWYFLLKDFFSV